MERGRFGRTEARVRQDKQEGGEGEDEGMCGGGGTWRGGDGTSKYLSESHPRFGSAGYYWSYLFHKKQPATAKGEVEAGGQGRA